MPPIMPSDHRFRAALASASTFPSTAGEPSLAITFNCPKFTVEALPLDWVLPPAWREAGPTGEAGQRRGKTEALILRSPEKLNGDAEPKPLVPPNG